MLDHEAWGERHEMRKPCVRCGCKWGRITTRNGQDCVFCGTCNTYQYNAPKTETGRKPRTVDTLHNGITSKKRARIIARATGRCEMCGRHDSNGLHVGHLVSVDAGLRFGMTESQINDDENLAAMCAECNLGVGREPIPLRLAVAMVMARTAEGMGHHGSD